MLLPAGSLLGQTFTIDADVRPAVVNARVVTQAHDDVTGEDISNVRVFSFAFQEDPADPYFISDPGFSAIIGSGLPQGSQLNFNALGSLRFWNGSGAVGFGNTANHEQLRINRGAADVYFSDGSGPQNGFAIANVSAGGVMHAHLNTFLLGNDSYSPTDGLYLAALDVGCTDAGIARSLPTYFVFNNGAPADALDRALNYLVHPLGGDINFDGRVNTVDFNILAQHFGTGSATYLDGDLNENGIVDSTDFAIFLSGYGQSTVPVSSTAVPEPTMLALIGWCAVFLKRKR
jgi:hypothetical protein